MEKQIGTTQNPIVVDLNKKKNHVKKTTKRIWELDFLRGICVLLMVFDHTMFDIAENFGSTWAYINNTPFWWGLFNNASDYLTSDLRLSVQTLVVIIFASLCGISCSFSRNNLKRGLEVTFCALLITFVTSLEIIDMPIRFGILHMLGFAILLWWVISKICLNDKRRTAVICLVVGIAIIFIDTIMHERYLQGLFRPESSIFAFIAEWLNSGSFDSADYYPIFPYVGYMLIGAAAGPLIYPKRKSLLPKLGKYDWYAPFAFWGKIALWIYILHQVLITAILCIVSYLFITPGNLVFF